MPDETVVAGPVRDVVDVPGVHRRAVAVHAAHADVRRLFEIEMAARRTVVQTVALPWIDATRVVVVGPVGRKARVFLGRLVGAFRHIPAPRAPEDRKSVV